MSSPSQYYCLKPVVSPDKPGAALNNPPSPVSLLLPLCYFPLTAYTWIWVAWYYYFPDKFSKGLLVFPITLVLFWPILSRYLFSFGGLRTRPNWSAPHSKGPYHTSKDGTFLTWMLEQHLIILISKNHLFFGSPSRQRSRLVSIVIYKKSCWKTSLSCLSHQ